MICRSYKHNRLSKQKQTIAGLLHETCASVFFQQARRGTDEADEFLYIALLPISSGCTHWEAAVREGASRH